MNISILRVVGMRSTSPHVRAEVDEHRVEWSPRKNWTCTCLTEADEFLCEHVDALLALLDPRVLAGPTTTTEKEIAA